MKYLLVIFSFLFLSVTVYTQDYNDLDILYTEGAYDSLVKKAESYTADEKTKYDPKPYFWAAKGLYKISVSGTDDERFKNAYKDAIKFLGKGIKYDQKKNNSLVSIEEEDFINSFQMTLFEKANKEISDGDFKHGFSWVMRYSKISENKVGSNYLLGACKYESADKTTARYYWKEADAELETIESIENWSEADRNMLKYGILYTAGALKRSGQVVKAKELVGNVTQWFEDDEDWQDLYNEIVNKP
jgi:hypothetical protein